MKIKYLFICCLVLFGIDLFGHEQIVHQEITAKATDAANSDSLAFKDFISLINSDGRLLQDAKRKMVEGSYNEDWANQPGDDGGKRSFNHFYDPLDTTYGKGLSDVPIFGRRLVGNNSFVWASVLHCQGINFPGVSVFGFGANMNTANEWNWPDVRDYEWLGLTANTQADRQEYLDRMFRSVGQVMHLLEDTTSPQHVRNEQHLPPFWKSHIEDWGKRNANPTDFSMLDWRRAGFTKLENFWDRHLYNGSAAALDNAETTGGTLLGLAEWCNGNFLGERHQYADYYPQGDIRHYPYPSLAGTDYQQVKANPSSGMDDTTLLNGNSGKAIYLAKTGNGISITHQSRVTFLGAMFPDNPGPKSTTVNDPKVIKDYHVAFIPKAVKYSAGLLDYYFRGQLEVGVSANTGGSGGTLKLTIKNASNPGGDFQGGAFHLYYDNAVDSTRTELTGSGNGGFWTTWGSGSTLATNTTTATFTPPSGVTVKQYILVYQGNIGTIGQQPDPVDQNIAIAAKAFTASVYPSSWWPMEQIVTAGETPVLPNESRFWDGNCIDVIAGVRLGCWGDNTDAGNLSYGEPFESIMSGKRVNAARLNASTGAGISSWSSVANLYAAGNQSYATPNGVTWCGWFKCSNWSQSNIHIMFTLGSAELALTQPDYILGDKDYVNLYMNASGSATTIQMPTDDTWHFFLLEYIPNLLPQPDYNDITGTWRLQFDNSGEVHTVSDSNGMANPLDTRFYVDLSNRSGQQTIALDELGVFPMILTQQQKSFLFDSGDGITWPFAFPE